MIIIKIPLLSWFLLLSFILTAQNREVDFNNYQTILSQGSLPAEFSTTSTEKYIQNAKNISRKERRRIRKAKREFYLQSSFAIDDILRSGRVLFNDTIGNYVNKVFDKVLANETELRRQAKVFVVKTEHSNAFATDQGAIFITTGLLARLQNEAQLAFILCHEVVHFKRKHSIEIFVNKETRDRSEIKKNGGFESEPELLARAAYSKEKEQQADEEGLMLFLKSNYANSEAISTFDVLLYSYQPFDKVSIENTFFDSPNLIWPYEYFKDEVTTVHAEDDEDDSKSTHPNIFKRKQALKNLLNGKDITEGERFLVSESDFLYIQKICRYELCRQALLNQHYCEAIYYAAILQKENPESIFLKKVMAKSLHAISIYKAEENNKLKFDYKNIQGNLQQLYYFFSKLKGREAGVLALQHIWSLKQLYPNDAELAMLADKSFYNLAKKYNEKPDYFSDTTLPDTLNPKIITDQKHKKQKNIDSSSSPNEIRQKKPELKITIDNENKEKEVPKVHLRYAFADFINDSSFRTSFSNNSEAELKKEYKKRKRIRFHTLKKEAGDKIVIFDPLHYSIDERKKKAIKLDANEKEMAIFVSRIEESAEAAEIPVELLSAKEFTTTDVEKLNRLSVIKDWLGECIEHNGLDIPATDYDKIADLRKEVDSRYICLIGHVHFIEKKKKVAAAIAVSVLLPVYSWIFTFKYLFVKEQVSVTLMMVIDLETGKQVAVDFSAIKANNRQDITLSTLYDFMIKIKKYQLENR